MSEFVNFNLIFESNAYKDKSKEVLEEVCKRFKESGEEPFNKGIVISKKSNKCEIFFEYSGFSIRQKIQDSLNYLSSIGGSKFVVVLKNTQVGDECYFTLVDQKIVVAESRKEIEDLLKPAKQGRPEIEAEFYSKFENGDGDTVLLRVKPRSKRSLETLVNLLNNLIQDPNNTEFYRKFCEFINAASDMTDIEYPSLIYVDGERRDGPDYFISGICYVKTHENDVFIGFRTPKGFVLINDGFEILVEIFSLVFKKVSAKLRFSKRPSIERYFFVYDGEVQDVQKEKQLDGYWLK